MKKFLEKEYKIYKVLGIALSVCASVFLVTLISYSATTISANISTAGTLDIGGGSTITKLSFGVCNIAETDVGASSTAYVDCTGATGVSSGAKIFVTATSSLPQNYSIQAASSTLDDTIHLLIFNNGMVEDPDDNTGVRTFNWMAIE
ncbi:hypothetical protein ACFLZ0_01170 [Patescibacteria group bacterium]